MRRRHITQGGGVAASILDSGMGMTGEDGRGPRLILPSTKETCNGQILQGLLL